MSEPYDIDYNTGEELTAEDVIERKNEEMEELKLAISEINNEINRFVEYYGPPILSNINQASKNGAIQTVSRIRDILEEKGA